MEKSQNYEDINAEELEPQCHYQRKCAKNGSWDVEYRLIMTK